jgi:hypothetical protein
MKLPSVFNTRKCNHTSPAVMIQLENHTNIQYNWILNFIFRCLTDPLERFLAQYNVVPGRERN